ncbi:MAG: hypothetical protein M3O36_09050 [Myxococcota bacterium]|nr:hypothetical protein [Myxococcota bacterium]
MLIWPMLVLVHTPASGPADEPELEPDPPLDPLEVPLEPKPEPPLDPVEEPPELEPEPPFDPVEEPPELEPEPPFDPAEEPPELEPEPPLDPVEEPPELAPELVLPLPALAGPPPPLVPQDGRPTKVIAASDTTTGRPRILRQGDRAFFRSRLDGSQTLIAHLCRPYVGDEANGGSPIGAAPVLIRPGHNRSVRRQRTTCARRPRRSQVVAPQVERIT